MPSSLILLFNHQLTPDQQRDAMDRLGVSGFVQPPTDLQELWGNVPPQLPSIHDYLEPIKHWLAGIATPGDHVLIQGDFGATCLMVAYATSLGCVPVYSTTLREAVEELQPDGSVQLRHRFRHVRFRKYSQ